MTHDSQLGSSHLEALSRTHLKPPTSFVIHVLVLRYMVEIYRYTVYIYILCIYYICIYIYNYIYIYIERESLYTPPLLSDSCIFLLIRSSSLQPFFGPRDTYPRCRGPLRTFQGRPWLSHPSAGPLDEDGLQESGELRSYVTNWKHWVAWQKHWVTENLYVVNL